MSNIALCEKVDKRIQLQIRKSILSYLENKLTRTFVGTMPTPQECNFFSRQSLAQEFTQTEKGLMELCKEHYQEEELSEQMEILVDLLIPVAYYKTYASKHLKWQELQRTYKGIEMLNGMDYTFIENYNHEGDLKKEMKCYVQEENYKEISDEEMNELCDLCNQHDYYLIHSELLDSVIVKALIQELKKGKIPQERLHGMYPASMFLEPVPDESEYIFYID